jgi:predicted Ser/Thr protein kinase
MLVCAKHPAVVRRVGQFLGASEVISLRVCAHQLSGFASLPKRGQPQRRHDSGERAVDRWEQWKLSDEKIAELTRSSADSNLEAALQLRGKTLFSRGKHGIIHTALMPLHSKGSAKMQKVALKQRRLHKNEQQQHASYVREGEWLKRMNSIGIGPQFFAADDLTLIYKWTEGEMVIPFLEAASTTAADVRWLIQELLRQCFLMDEAMINKQELTHPEMHLLITPSVSVQPSKRICIGNPSADIGAAVSSALASPASHILTMLDFDRCVCAPRTKMCNVTQITQFLTSKRVVQLIIAHRSKQAGGPSSVEADLLAIQQARKGAGRYKKAPCQEALLTVAGALMLLLDGSTGQAQ